MFKTKPSRTPLEGKELLLADLDGVVYRGENPIKGAVEAINTARKTHRVGYVTNNASRKIAEIAAQLQELGLEANAQDIVTSAQAAGALMETVIAPPATILIVGGDGVEEELQARGYTVTRSETDDPQAVLQGGSKEICWSELAEASYALAEKEDGTQIPWIATNTDWTIPMERGLAPGNGTMVSAVHTAVARLPVFAGKPEIPIYETAFKRFGSKNALMIGDRLDTDIQGARAAGIESAHVLTGSDRPKQLLAASANMRPDYILEKASGILEPYPEIKVGKDGAVKVGKARVRMNGHIVEVVREGDDPLNLLRAGCEAIWRSGLAIYGLKVPDVLLIDHWQKSHV